MSTPKFRMAKKIASMALVLVLGTGVASCASPQDQAAPAEDENAMHVTMAVIGPDENGEPEFYVPEAEMTVAAEADAWALSQDLFALGNLEYDASNSDYGIMLNSITSPVDGTVLAWDEATGCYWQLFVNGEASEVGISEVELADGMEIVWYYSAFGDTVPELSALPAAA